MKQYSAFILHVTFFLGLSAFLPLKAADCSMYQRPVTVRVNIHPGTVRYNNSLSNSQFPSKPYASTMGLTVAQLTINMQAKSFVREDSTGACIGLDELTVNVGFPKIDVYIDKKYRPGTCQYNVIKEHENYHVRVQQEGLTFFGGKIEEAFQIAANKIKPRSLSSPGQAQSILNQMVAQVKKDVDPLIKFVEKRLREENEVIDTYEAYLETSKKCKKW